MLEFWLQLQVPAERGERRGQLARLAASLAQIPAAAGAAQHYVAQLYIYIVTSRSPTPHHTTSIKTTPPVSSLNNMTVLKVLNSSPGGRRWSARDW